MSEREEHRVHVISTGGPARPGRNGEISRQTKGAPGLGPDPIRLRLRAGSSTPLRSAQDDKGGEGSAHSDRAAGGFTLIELLVVISIVVLLMAMLLPALSRARKQARAVVCQSRLHDWSLMFAAYQNDNEGRLPDGIFVVWDHPLKYHFLPWPAHMEVYSGSDLRDAMRCPSAAKPVPPGSYRARSTLAAPGATFLAWRLAAHEMMDGHMPYSEYIGSYGMNHYLRFRSYYQRAVRNVKPAALPVFFDSRACYGRLRHDGNNEPPPYEDFILDVMSSVPSEYIWPAVLTINRHQGGINMLFGDGAIRKVGVKELWTLKWSEDFDNHGPWTKAGGVSPGDWPHWMRQFKDY